MAAIQKTKEPEEKEDNGFDVGFKVPDTKSLLDRMDEARLRALKGEHMDATAEEEKEDKKAGKKRQPKQKQGGTICCCQDPGCGIGPFIERS